MSETLVWWLMAQVVGLSALPLCLALFSRLPDRGYALSKPFALLAVGYVFWVLNIALPFFHNNTGNIWVVVILFFAASAYLLWRRQDELLAFVRERWWLIAAVEALFFLTFITAAFLRSYTPEISGTEKPMDFMFLNAVTNGDSFPPEDPWLVGENVAYYYFGYLLISIMTRLTDFAPWVDVPTGVGFNLGLAMIVALTVVAAFSLVYNLAAPREQRRLEAGPGTPASGFSRRLLWWPMAFGLVGALFIVMMGNLNGFLELLAAHDFGSARFWSWIGVSDLAGYDSTRWFPDQHWFWWKSTRILDGGRGIHEFPFFSFLLGDVHPHVMSIPFVLLAAGVGLHLLRSDEPLDLVVWLERPLWLVAFGVMLGALAFLNTWDMPTLAFVLTVVALMRNRMLAERWSWGLALDTAGFVAPLFLVGFLAYTPFFFGGFDSQASGFTAEAGAGSGLLHTFLIWGPFAFLILPYAVWRLSRSSGRLTWAAALWSLAPAALVVLLWLSWALLANAFGWLPGAMKPNEAATGLGTRFGERGWNWLTVFALAGSLGLLGLALVREAGEARRSDDERTGHVFALTLSGTATLLILGTEFIYIQDTFASRMNTIFKLYYQAWLLLSVAGGFVLYELARGWGASAVERAKERTRSTSLSIGDLVVIASTAVGAIVGILLAPDALTGLFGAIVGAGIFFVLSGATVLLAGQAAMPSGSAEGAVGVLSWRGVWAGGVAVVLIAAFVYPLIATFNRTNAFDLPEGVSRSLDGLNYLSADQRAAIEWLAERDGQPVIAEGLGGDYSAGGFVSAATGLPTLLQWPGHELQWRGTSEPQTGRTEDLEALYTATSPEEVQQIIQKYNIRYVVVGDWEQETYENLTLPEMDGLFAEICGEPEAGAACSFQQGRVTVYRVRPGVLSEVTRE
ncbi:MAG: DUF2298 domain-containing protein [Dehalococcoidia bacterium]|nr:DUF2298 domain-containing protein [Dehalococcoidia bacterium]